MGLKDRLFAGAKSTGLFAATRFASRKSLRILCYHGLWTSPGAPFGECLFMSVDRFAERMRWLKASRYPVLDLDDAVTRLHEGTLPRRQVSGPVGRTRERFLQARQHVDRFGQRRLLAFDHHLVDTDGNIPPENRKRRLAFQAQRAWTGE